MKDPRLSTKVGNIELRFLDSMKFLPESLDTLSRGVGSQNLNYVRAAFPDDRHFQLCSRKAIFPYEYILFRDIE